jgi:hypothetical protein
MDEQCYACRGMGTPIEPSDFVTPFDKLLQDILDQANTLFQCLRSKTKEVWRSRRFYIMFTDGVTMNARCRRLKSIDYIILPIGALEKIGGATLGIMAEPSFCPRIGKVSLESGICIKLEGGFPPFPLLQDGYDENMKLSVVWPDCRVRAAYGQHLLVNAVRYMIMHEMGHIFGGHLDGATLSYDENSDVSFTSDPSTGNKIVPRLVEEVDADMFATFHLAGMEMSDELSHSLVEMFPWKGLSPGQVAFVTQANTIGILFRLIENKSWAFPEMAINYPPPIVRALFALGSMLSCCVNANLLKMADGPKLVTRSVRDIDRVWQMHKLPGHGVDQERDWTSHVGGLSEKIYQLYESHSPALTETARLKPIWKRGYWPLQ